MSDLDLEAHKIRRTRDRWSASNTPMTTASVSIPTNTPAMALEQETPAEPIREQPIRSRGKREKQMHDLIDRRSLRATGRTAQWNVRIRPDQKKDVQRRAKKAKLSGGASEYLEKALAYYAAAEDRGEVECARSIAPSAQAYR